MRKVKIFWIMMTTLVCMLSSCSNAQNSPTENAETMKEENVLIVYLTRTNNTEAVAKMIHKKVGGTLVELELVTPYPENYEAIVAQVVREDEAGYRPPLKTKIDSMEKYDVVFVGFPTWNMQLPPPIRSFLSEYDLSGKTVIPFNTNGGYGLGSSIRQLKDLCSESNIFQAFSTRGGSETDGIYLAIEGERKKEVHTAVMKWLKEIGLINK